MKKIILCLMVLFVACKESKEEPQDKTIPCAEKFDELYSKRYSLWFSFESIGIESYDNFTREKYLAMRSSINDSLEHTINCAINQDRGNLSLYLYKMKSFYFADKLDSIPGVYNKVAQIPSEEGLDFQLALFNTLSQELSSDKIDAVKYKELKLLFYFKKLDQDINYSYGATTEFLDFLENNDLNKFKKEIKEKYPETNDKIDFDQNNDRKKIIRDILIRADGLVFD